MGNNTNTNLDAKTPSSETVGSVHCELCNYEMKELQRCHLRCPNCGSELTCSDIW